MRILPVAACFAFLALCGEAEAASCTKGMLWPFVRNPGDCLTDAEEAAGKRGVYEGPVNNNVDVSAIKTDATGQQLPENTPAAKATAVQDNAVCNKGVLWPFLRDPGDCLTDAEKKAGQHGVYRGKDVPAGTAVAAASGPTPAGTATASDSPNKASGACSKGWLWPFVREPNDCPTDVEKATAKKADASEK